MVRCLCLDDQSRPKEIPTEKWIKRDEVYHIIKVNIQVNQNGIQSYDLHEIELDERHIPYESFKASRFAIHCDDIEEFIELVKNSAELDNIDINIDELTKELVEQEF